MYPAPSEWLLCVWSRALYPTGTKSNWAICFQISELLFFGLNVWYQSCNSDRSEYLFIDISAWLDKVAHLSINRFDIARKTDRINVSSVEGGELWTSGRWSASSVVSCLFSHQRDLSSVPRCQYQILYAVPRSDRRVYSRFSTVKPQKRFDLKQREWCLISRYTQKGAKKHSQHLPIFTITQTDAHALSLLHTPTDNTTI